MKSSHVIKKRKVIEIPKNQRISSFMSIYDEESSSGCVACMLITFELGSWNAQKVFQQMLLRDVVSWNSIIVVYEHNHVALELNKKIFFKGRFPFQPRQAIRAARPSTSLAKHNTTNLGLTI